MLFCFMKCDFCDYKTDKKFNLQRHQNAKHKEEIEKLRDENKDTTRAQNVPINSEKLPRNLQKLPQNFQKLPYNFQKVPIASENILLPNEHVKSVQFNDDVEENIITPNKKKLFSCKKCSKQYNTKTYLVKHEERCKGIDIVTCPRCMKSFSNTKHKSRHIKANRCKPRSRIYARNNNPQQMQNITNNINNTNIENQQNIYNNIYINNFGSERIDYITYEDIKHILMQGHDTVPLFIEKKHFHKDFPENHNIKYTKDNRCKIYENDTWKEKDIGLLSSKLVEDNSRTLLLLYKDNEIGLAYDIKNDDLLDYIKNNLLELRYRTSKNYNEIKSTVADIVKSTRE